MQFATLVMQRFSFFFFVPNKQASKQQTMMTMVMVQRLCCQSCCCVVAVMAAMIVMAAMAAMAPAAAGNVDPLGDEIELGDDDLPYIHPVRKPGARSVGKQLPSISGFVPPREPTLQELKTMRIALASVAAPLSRETASDITKYVLSACLVFESFQRHTNFQNVDFLLVTRNTSWAFTPASRAVAKACKMKVVERPLAIKTKYITDPTFKKILHDKSHAGIGLLDYDFLWPWSFEEYDKVLVLDSDTFVTKNIDHLFTPDVDMVFTNGPKSHVNGGMQLIRPNLRTFIDMRNRVIAPNAYRRETGWYNHGFIPPDQYGSATLQGFLTYYFTAVNTNVLQVPRHLYNFQFDHISVATGVPCDDVYMFHFTACPKPMVTTVSRFKIIKEKANKPEICECAFLRYKAFQRHLLEVGGPELVHIIRKHMN